MSNTIRMCVRHRGVHEISGLKPANSNGGVASFNRYSPTFLAGLLKPDQVQKKVKAGLCMYGGA